MVFFRVVKIEWRVFVEVENWKFWRPNKTCAEREKDTKRITIITSQQGEKGRTTSKDFWVVRTWSEIYVDWKVRFRNIIQFKLIEKVIFFDCLMCFRLNESVGKRKNRISRQIYEIFQTIRFQLREVGLWNFVCMMLICAHI